MSLRHTRQFSSADVADVVAVPLVEFLLESKLGTRTAEICMFSYCGPFSVFLSVFDELVVVDVDVSDDEADLMKLEN